jgi:enoyl-CoA hydratase/carnithine racemase
VKEQVFLKAVARGVFEIWLDRPERMNALGVATCAELKQAVSDAGAQCARVVLVRGSGRAFCAGADLKERKGMDLAARLAHNAAIRAAIDALASARFVTIAVLNGVALGGGLELALGCDLRFAASGIDLGLTESRVGAFPGGRHATIASLIGVSRALQMMLSGEPVTANTRSTSDSSTRWSLPRSSRLARMRSQVARGRSAPALATIKRLVHEGIELPLAAGLQVERAALPEILGSADYAEGLAAFAERRPPHFTEVVQ